jgi:superfamily II DNA helicase RecQ
MLDSFFAYLEYISSFLYFVSIWSEENFVIVEKFLRLIQVLTSKEKKIDDSRVQILDKNSTKIEKRHLKKLKIEKKMSIRESNLEVSSRVVWTNEELIMKLKNIHDYKSKSEQLKIIMCVLNDRDCIFSIKTKYEKSIILYSSSTLRVNTINLLIISLNVLQNDQKSFILRMNSNIKSCVFNDEIIIKKLLNEIKYEMYNHILINFELVLFNESFKVVLQSSFFRERLVLVVIDEIHLMKNWSN